MTVKVRVVGVIPFYSVTADVNTSICLAQTVIVGKAPSSYTDIEGGVSPVISQYDYGLHARGINIEILETVPYSWYNNSSMRIL